MDEDAIESADNPWMGTKAASDYLGIRGRTLYRLIDEGQVPAYKVGRVIRLKRPDLDDFIEASRVEPGTLGHLYPRKDDEKG